MYYEEVYYEERVIRGILHSRTSPHGKFTPFTAKQLTEMYMKLQREFTQRPVSARRVPA